MANVKNITDLPLAESAEGLNLIVNDGGFAKQIAASAVGAQADFNVIDENSPAYIKNKPSVAQADWAETDENSPAFVKNKPGVAQPDWNETDESKAAFIKNKPFWVEENVTEEILPLTTYTLGDPQDGTYSSEITNSLKVEENKIYQVSYNNTLYSCVANKFEFGIRISGLALGNMSMAGFPIETEDTKEPFCITIAPGFPTMLMAKDLEVSLSISYVGDVYHTINPKYIEDMYYTEKVENIEVLAEITKTPEVSEDNGNMIIHIEEPMVTLVENGIYTVTWNGVEYQCMCMTEMVGTTLIPAPTNGPSGFAIIQRPEMKNEGFNAIVIVNDGSESVTMSITGSWDEIHKIDPKYIPDEGYETQATGLYSHAEGYQTMASDSYSHAEGYKTEASGAYSHAEGNETKAGRLAHAEGMKTSAFGLCAHAEGDSANASSTGAHAEGGNTAASGNYSHAEGYKTEASGNYSHAEGNNTTASENSSHAEGWDTTASGVYSHAEGERTTASGQGSHAEGFRTKATLDHAHAEGRGAQANGAGSHAEGLGTVTSGQGSHAEGNYSTANGDYSHAEGLDTQASSQSQHVQGEYNVIDTEGSATARGKYAHIVGNGTNTFNRSNAHTLDWNGNAWYAGTVECAGIILTSPNGTKYQISVADDGTLSANAIPS